jgi:transcription elongation factor GreA
VERRSETPDSSKEKKKPEAQVKIGSIVTVEQDGAPLKIRIISDEFNGGENDDAFNASYESPVGMALLSGKVGDIVRYSLPSGRQLEMTIKKIE